MGNDRFLNNLVQMLPTHLLYDLVSIFLLCSWPPNTRIPTIFLQAHGDLIYHGLGGCSAWMHMQFPNAIDESAMF